MSEAKEIKGVLVNYKGTLGWSPSKKNAERTQQVCDGAHASEDAGKWIDNLFPPSACGKQNAFTILKTHLGRMKTYTMETTFVFEDALWRILPAKAVDAYRAEMERGKEKAMELLDNLVDEMPTLKLRASMPEPAGRGQLFNEDDYPDNQTIREKFTYQVSYRPVPVASGFTVAMQQEEIDALNALHVVRLKEANESLVARFMEPLSKLAEQLKDPKNRKIEPVLGRILEISSMIPSLDLNDNAKLVEMANDIHSTFSLVTPELLKSDEDMRKLVGDTAGKYVTALNAFGGVAKRQIA